MDTHGIDDGNISGPKFTCNGSKEIELRKGKKSLFKYFRGEPEGMGQKIENVLWYKDSVELYIKGSNYIEKEVIYYSDDSKKSIRISADSGNQSIRKYYKSKLQGYWISPYDTIVVDDEKVILKSKVQETYDLHFTKMALSQSYLLKYDEMILCYTTKGYLKLIQISDNNLVIHSNKESIEKDLIIKYKRVLNYK